MCASLKEALYNYNVMKEDIIKIYTKLWSF